MNSTSKERMQEAIVYHKEGNLAAARDLYMDILIDDENNADAWHLLGLIELKEGREEGFEMILKAIRLCPNSPLFYSNIAHHYKHYGQHKKALEHFLNAYEISPRHTTLFEIALLYQMLASNEKALHCYEIILATNPSHSQSLNNIGVIYAQKGEWNIAQAYFQKALDVKPSYEDALKNITVAEQKQSD
ncbi:hypothetical protein CCZ01_02830 [Helicobacter monodelphidis]|uniref:tetratricopeptide repeat protein n=1 Tax=Helicobacter sp. 15-1451 TaxID=2004995 RepID=UPI000DCDAEE9|nr:tetratricopeptide repeat protein [Helicobacter sp. 15-1451]RAX58368.1 hypothetical protein CCZ01_02830 [Helicobacter sp. 15-1451]